jgi:hypothetical protein
MSNGIFIQSLLNGSVIDVKGAQAVAGTEVHTFPQKSMSSPPTPEQWTNAANQLWTFPASPTESYFWILSNLGGGLVVDIRNDVDQSGTVLQIATQKPGSSIVKNQLWTWVAVGAPAPPGTLFMTYWMIQNLANKDLVIAFDGTHTEEPLIVQTKKPTGSQSEFDAAKNQLWSQVEPFIPPPK